MQRTHPASKNLPPHRRFRRRRGFLLGIRAALTAVESGATPSDLRAYAETIRRWARSPVDPPRPPAFWQSVGFEHRRQKFLSDLRRIEQGGRR